MTASDPRPRILMVVCDPVAPSGLIGGAIMDKGGFYDTILPGERFASWQPLDYSGLPDAPTGYDGLVILGGPMSATDEADLPWLRELGALSRSFEESGKAVLGVCLGAQIMARAYGARVWHMGTLEAGYVELQVTEEGQRDPLFAGLGGRMTPFQHHYEAFDLPPGGVNLLTGGLCEVQAFRLGRAAYGLQCHLEVTVDIVREWVRRFGASEFKDEPRLLSALDAGFQAHMRSQRRLAKEVFGRWVELARSG
jgi:GMP synthase-like glutamine amidotransferase